MANQDPYPTPGLKWRPRKDGPVPYWVPRADAVKAGYSSMSYMLKAYAHDPALLSDKCRALQNSMLAWLEGHRGNRTPEFDGTFKAVLRLYQTHEDSPYHKLKPGTLAPYNSYLRRLEGHIGAQKVVDTSALDVKRWHKDWSYQGTKLAAGAMAVNVLKAALSFAVTAKHRECRELLEDIREISFPNPKPRELSASADDIVALRKAAHEIGRPSAALCFAIQFETTLRLWDVKGQWFDLSWAGTSSVISGNKKWIGLEWRHIGADMILRYRPSKTDGTTGKEVTIDLSLCPMVLEEIERIPAEKRHGPVIVNELNGGPWARSTIANLWPRVREMAGLPDTLWCRDLRASGITEARAAGVAIEDAAKIAGHSKSKTTSTIYDRANLDAHRRVAAMRIQARAGGVPRSQ